MPAAAVGTLLVLSERGGQLLHVRACRAGMSGDPLVLCPGAANVGSLLSFLMALFGDDVSPSVVAFLVCFAKK